jgi:hypothetical protein
VNPSRNGVADAIAKIMAFAACIIKNKRAAPHNLTQQHTKQHADHLLAGNTPVFRGILKVKAGRLARVCELPTCKKGNGSG